MKNKQPTVIAALLLTVLLIGVYYFMMPQSYDKREAPLSEFSTKRALEKVKEISKNTHFVGSQNHEVVALYLQKELQDLGLETSIQQGFTMTEKGTLVKAKNIVAKLKGSNDSKALVLLSHYDSAPHSYSLGASDDASGLATILESLRAFLHNKTKHKNDIIILFTDAEEIGLNGAALFVTQHQWVKDVSLVLNFEARGSSGPSYMLMETNNGNSKMVDIFKAANATYPVSNSLMYSIYKMLPNDTDLTVFREIKKIQGFNFAFINSHYNYHTARDNYENLSPKTLAHQGSYLSPLLTYFSNIDLTDLNSNENQVYFNTPFAFINYPFSWIFPLLFISIGLLILFTFIGLAKRIIQFHGIIRGFIPFIGALITSGLLTYVGWKLILNFYPQYNDILQGFTYNGHDYVYAFVSLTLAVCFLFYKKQNKENDSYNHLIAPLIIWLLINAIIALKLEGAAFLIIPVLCSLTMFIVFVLRQKNHWILNIMLAIPTLILVVPFITMFPVGLGLKILFGSSILTVLAFSLLIPILGNFERKILWATLCFLLSIGFFIKAHISSSFDDERPKPNSLVYILDSDTQKANWATYDTNLDEWTKIFLGENPANATALNTNKLYSKYGSSYKYMAEAPLKTIQSPTIELITDSLSSTTHFYKIKISPNRNVNRYDVFVKNGISINNLIANGVKSTAFKSNISSKTTAKILSYYVVENIPLEMEFSIKSNEKLDLDLVESSFDLMTHPDFKILKRKSWMIPKPFVLTDAVIIKQKIKPSKLNTESSKLPFQTRRYTSPDSLNIVMDTLK